MQKLLIIINLIIVINRIVIGNADSYNSSNNNSSSGCHLEVHHCVFDVLQLQSKEESKSPPRRHVPEDVNISLVCQKPLAVWYYDNQVMHSGTSWLLDRANASVSGNYACQYSGSKWANLTLHIGSGLAAENHEISGGHDAGVDTDSKNFPSNYRLKFTKPIQRLQHSLSGKTLKLSCPFTAFPPANITWSFKMTGEKDFRPLERLIGGYSYRKYSLRMDDIITTDSAVYKCRVCNPLKCIEEEIRVMVNDRFPAKPRITPMANTTALVNSRVVLKCDVISDNEPTVTWIRVIQQKESLNTDGNGQEEGQMMRIKLNTSLDTPHILELNNVSYSQEGWYTCIAASSLGTTNASLYLHVVNHLPFMHLGELRGTHPYGFVMTAIMILLIFLLGSAFIVYKLRRKMLNDRVEKVYLWTKNVIIYKPEDSALADELQFPVIKIEKQRTTFSNTTSSGNSSDPAQAFNEYEFPLDSNWEIARQQLSLGSILGEGAFGRVVMAEADGLTRCPPPVGSGSTIVAVKMVKEEHTDADMASLVREMEVMKMIGKHINIINLLGCCSQNGPLWVIVEYAPHGNLKDFLKQNRLGMLQGRTNSNGYVVPQQELGESELIMFALQIARGMKYLASRRCIHRDLAARNVLVSDDHVMKIADFGLARDIQKTDYYRKNTNGLLPVKWMAPESLKQQFYDCQSDVWSYGVLLWEIMTYGEQPYPTIWSVEKLYSYLITGQRMEKPPTCSLNIYMVMRQCWNFEPSARPTFAELVDSFDGILQQYNNKSIDYLDLSMPMLQTPPSSGDEQDNE